MNASAGRLNLEQEAFGLPGSGQVAKGHPMDTIRRTVDQSLVAEIVSSYLKKNQLSPAELPALINTVYQSLLSLGKLSNRSRRPQRCRSGDRLLATMLFASNVAGKGIRCVGTSRRGTA